MNVRAQGVFLRVVAIIAGSVAGFVILQEPARRLEAHASNWLLSFVPGRHTLMSTGTSIVVIPTHGAVFRAVITPSCSAVTSLLAIGCLAGIAIPMTRRGIVALAVSLAIVAVGNILRIVASIGVGIVYGRSSLILFHDWIGGFMTFIYTLGGYIVLLYLLLPGDSRAESEPQSEQLEATHVG